jgi:hypothetical protein
MFVSDVGNSDVDAVATTSAAAAAMHKGKKRHHHKEYDELQQGERGHPGGTSRRPISGRAKTTSPPPPPQRQVPEVPRSPEPRTLERESSSCCISAGVLPQQEDPRLKRQVAGELGIVGLSGLSTGPPTRCMRSGAATLADTRCLTCGAEREQGPHDGVDRVN